jgi:tetratricopeptide (TPR) repeat protein
MASAIELYQRAYDLDYRKGDWESAEELYRTIVEKFPYSEEKEYAQVHLQRLEKLKANPHEQALQPVRAHSGVNAFNLVNFMLILIVLVALGVTGYLGWIQYRRNEYNELLISGLLSETGDDPGRAEIYYKQAQNTLGQNPLAYRCLAELYLRQDKRELAQIEYKLWKMAKPYDPALKQFEAQVSSEPESDTMGETE